MTQHTASQRGTVEYWHTGKGKFTARDNYTSAEFTPSPGYSVRAQAYAALGRSIGDIQAEVLRIADARNGQ